MKKDGVILHAKHAYMPNSLGYCGPDENGTIQEHLTEGKAGEKLVRALQGFEAAYPFLKLIARNSGRDVFDYSVPEAYWIGNGLLETVPPADFYKFASGELRGMGSLGARGSLKELGGDAFPHHTFYVMSSYIGTAPRDGPALGSEKAQKVAQLIDDCRISWGEVRGVGRRELVVRSTPVAAGEAGLGLARGVIKRVAYNPEVKPFGSVRPGDFVSLHWNYACEVLTPRQMRNLVKYTDADIALVNRILSSRKR